MRVVMVTPTAAPGGAERALAGLARHLGHRGFDVTVVSLARGPALEWFQGPSAVTVIEAGRARQLVRTAVTIRRLRRHIDQAAVVIGNQSKGHVYAGVAARRWPARSSIPAIFWQHGVPQGDRLDRLAARVPAAAIVCSTDQAVRAQRALTPEDREVVKIPPGIDVTAVRRAAGSGRGIRERLGWDRNRVVGIVGRLQPWKGQHVFLEAAARVAPLHPDARFAVVGGAVMGWEEADYPASLEQLAAERGISDRVHFAGHQDDVYAWFDALDVVVHASVDEPFGLVVLEAMALGKPVVAARSGGPIEIVEHERTGLLASPTDPTEIATEVGRLLADPDLAEQLGRRAVLRADQLSEERAADSWTALITRVAGPTPKDP